MALTLSKTSRHSVCGETDLVAATRAGDDRAFEELYSRYRDRILAFIVSKVHDHGRAEDIAQDVFMSALRRMRSNDQHIAFKPWIYEIAKNACIDEFRRGSRSREVPLESDGEFVTDRQATLGVVGAPATAIESKQRLDDLRGAFGGLSANHHQLLVMREFEGMSYDEIGQRLDMTRQMVESGLFRARRKLSEEYEELASGRRCAQIQTAIEAGTMQSVSALGLRDRRRFARHLSHCQPCRHAALMAGVDEALVKPRSIAAKIAAFLPFPLVRWPWGGGRGRGRGGAGKAGAGSHHLAASSLPNAAPAASSALGPAAAAVAVLALAGAGAGIGHGLFGGGPTHRAIHAAPAADHTALRSTGSSGRGGAGSAGASSGATQRLVPGQAALGGNQSGLRFAGRSSSTTGGGHAGSTGAAGAGTASASSPAHGGSATSGVARSIADAQSKLRGAAGGLGSTVSGTTQALGHTVQGVGTAVHKVTKTVGNVVNGATGTVNKTVDGVTGAANKLTGGALAPVTGAANSAVNGATSAVNSAASGATTTAGNVVNGATSAVGNALSGLGAPGSGSGSSGLPGGSGSSGASTSHPSGSSPASGSSGSSSGSSSSGLSKVTSVVSKTLGGL
jgi:RNA polymerase sigma factor (sigma-70 family)